MDTTWKEILKEKLTHTLPGDAAHTNMQPESRKLQAQIMQAKFPKPRLGGVVVLIYPKNGAWHLNFMLRTDYEGTHGGQVSFPGGKYEDSDADLSETALREMEEEVGVKKNEVEILGKLSALYIPPSNFEVHPLVCLAEKRLEFIPDPLEVAEIIEIPISHLLNPAIQGVDIFRRDSKFQIQAPYYQFEKHKIWGATAMILSEFLSIGEELFD
jgi:8-oxo-dGTP pyrophosphatase MutT (NUDIX family)